MGGSPAVEIQVSEAEAQAALEQVYLVLLGREPDPGSAGWVSAYQGGEPIDSVMARMRLSPEYQAGHPSFVGIAQATLGNAGDPSDGFDSDLAVTLNALTAYPALAASADGAASEAAALDDLLAALDLSDLILAAGAGAAALEGAGSALASSLLNLVFPASGVPGLPSPPPAPNISSLGVGAVLPVIGIGVSPPGIPGLPGSAGGIPGTQYALAGGLAGVIGAVLAGAALPLIILNALGVNLSGPSAGQVQTDRRIGAPVVQSQIKAMHDWTASVPSWMTLSFAQGWEQAAVNEANASHLTDYIPTIQAVATALYAAIAASGKTATAPPPPVPPPPPISDPTRAAVRELYLTLLGREPDAAGWDFWVAQIEQHGRTFAQVAEGFTHSVEYLGKHRAGAKVEV